MKKTRCAIYTRKSSEDGLEQEFNSLDAQREACAAYIASQKHEGWVLLPDPYDDGGLSGGSLERPALQRLLDDIGAGRIDQIVVYKIDRLTRSLADFARIVDILDAVGASFVSVTQSFNTATSMGRLTLNMLLSFAQFEREVTAERIRDKISASKKKGLWMGGNVPLGYDPDGRILKINATEAETVRTLFDLYELHGVIRDVKAEADRLGLITKQRVATGGIKSGGQLFTRGHIHQILTNPIYAGRIRHKGQVHQGRHAAIIEPARWDALQAMMQEGAARRRERKARGVSRTTEPSPLVGKLYDETGDRLTPSHSRTKTGTRLRYYVSHRLVARSGEGNKDGWRLPAQEIETLAASLIREHLGRPAFILEAVCNLSSDEIGKISARLAKRLAASEADAVLCLAERIDLEPGAIHIALGRRALAGILNVDIGRITLHLPPIHAPFRMRKRGVETRLILDGAARSPDDTLIANIANAQAWYGMLKDGRTFSEIASETGISKRRIQQMLDLAFLAPDIVRDILDGRQALGLTSDWCLRHDLPSDWRAQRELVATL
ncbi:MAG: recombinase family protein [Pseudomonadota bacterium]